MGGEKNSTAGGEEEVEEGVMNNGGGYERIRASLSRRGEKGRGGRQGVHATLMFGNREGRRVRVCACVLCCRQRPWRRSVRGDVV